MKKISSREWYVLSVLSFFMLCQIIFSEVQVWRTEGWRKSISLPQVAYCRITLKGAVKKPGSYNVLPGTSIDSVIKKAGLQKFANTREIDLKKRVESDFELFIPFFEEFIFTVLTKEGEIVEVVMPKNISQKEIRNILKNTYGISLSKGRKINPQDCVVAQ